VNTVFLGKKDCISQVGIHETNGREAKQKASREGITPNPRGLTRRASVTNLVVKKGADSGFRAKGKNIFYFVSFL
jgi:hypothetical protein